MDNLGKEIEIMPGVMRTLAKDMESPDDETLREVADMIELLVAQRDEARAFIRQHFPKDG